MDDASHTGKRRLRGKTLTPGDRVAIMLRNCPEWVIFEQAALRLGLVVVPLYTADRPENAAYILRDAGVKVLLLEELAQWQAFSEVRRPYSLICARHYDQGSPGENDDGLVLALHDWLPDWSRDDSRGKAGEVEEIEDADRDPHQLATIIYTSGTSGRPKGVMLSHYNILTNAHSCLQVVPIMAGRSAAFVFAAVAYF